MGFDILETEYNKVADAASLLSEEKSENSYIKVRATVSCLNCGTNKIFKNKFKENNTELMVVSLKIFDWLVCDKCGDLLQLDLEFNI